MIVYNNWLCRLLQVPVAIYFIQTESESSPLLDMHLIQTVFEYAFKLFKSSLIRLENRKSYALVYISK